MLLRNRELYEFGQFRLDVNERQLARCSGKRVPISPKAFEVLSVLARNAGHLVSKQELMEEVWGDAFVEENNLDKCIHLIRRTLGEKPGEQKVIETVRKHGYRLLIDVRRIELGEDEANYQPSRTVSALDSDASVVEPVQARHDDLVDGDSIVDTSEPHDAHYGPTTSASDRKSVEWYRTPIFALLILAPIALASFFFFSGKAVSRAEDKISIVVLPAIPINAAARDDVYEIGIADSFIHRLSSIEGLVVRPLSTTRKYADITQDPLAAGSEQQVDFVLTSSYQLVEGKIRLTSQLYNVAKGTIDANNKFEYDSSNVLVMQDAAANDLGRFLSAHFDASSTDLISARGTKNEDAYRAYLQAMYLYDRRNVADLEKAVQLLERALRLDPGYALAWAGKAHAHRSLGNFGGDTHEQYRLSIEAINQALAFNPDLSDAHSALCENKFSYEYDYEGAERECVRAMQLNANSGRAHDIYARYLWTQKRFDEAIAESRTSIDLEPTALFSQRNYGIGLLYARRYDHAVDQFKRITEIDPTFIATYAWMIPALHVQGNPSEAYDWFMKWQTELKTDRATVEAYKAAYEADGWPGIGRERVKRFDRAKVRSYFLEACLIAHTGDLDKTFEYLEISFQRREWGISYLRIDPNLDSIRNDPRFEALDRRVELQKN